MVAVITGDIINSREGDVKHWITNLKRILALYGTESMDWEIFRGDSFQLKLSPELALKAAFHIKASIKQTGLYDVRMAIGLGEEGHKANKITESNGSAYILSGECFESLKKQTLALKTENQALDQALNLMISLALLVADNWSRTVARVILTSIEHEGLQQTELSKLLNKSQSSVSEALKRGGFDEIMNVNTYYQSQL